jgi:aminopeptidase N
MHVPTSYVPVLRLQVDEVNTQMAASLVTTLVDWEAYDEDRQQLMLAQLKRLAALGDTVSDDVMEVVRQAIRT